MKQIYFKVVTAFLVLMMMAALFEGVAIAGYLIRDRGFISVEQTMAREGNIELESRDVFINQRKEAGSFFGENIINPYWAYTKHSIPPFGTTLNREGFTGNDFPLEKEPGVFTIMISGGSVANAFFNVGQAKQLENELNRHFTGRGVRKFVIVNGAQDGWKEPQQASLLMQYGQGLDGYINLMGWNESNVISPHFSDRFETPPGEFFITLNHYYGGSFSTFLYQFDQYLKNWQHEHGLFQKSKLLYFLTQRLRNFCRYHLKHDEWLSNKAGEGYLRDQNKLPPGWIAKRREKFIYDSFRKYLRIENQFGKTMNFKTLFLIQPCVMIGKPLTTEEREIAGRAGNDLRRYARTERELLELQTENIPIYSLLAMFENTSESVYLDRCHFNDRGYQILRETLLRLIEKEWGFVRVT